MNEVGIFAQSQVSLEHQHLAKRYVVRGIESGGAVKDLGRYVAFCGLEGEPLPYLHPIDAIRVNGVHAVVAAPVLVRIELFRAGRTCQLLITKHEPGKVENGRRPRLENTILFRGVNGLVDLDLLRKLRQESTKSESRMVAERLLRDRLAKVEQGLPVAEMKKLKYEDIRKTLIMDYRTRGVKMLEEDRDGSPYVWGFEHLDPVFKNRLVRTITTDLLYQFIEKRQKEGAKNATINRNLCLLRRMMNLARREGKSVHFPYFPMLKENNVRKGFITPAQFIKLRDAMPEHLRPLMTFLYFTGCRIGAALAITWSQLESEKGRFQLRIEGNQTKNEDPILLPPPLELNEVLKKIPHQGRLFDARNLRKSFQAARVKVGLGVKTGPKGWQ